MPPPEPAVRFGPYRVVRKIAEGGQGAVHEVVHEQTGGRYALKTVLSSLCREASPETRARFRREAQTMARLSHPHVASIHAACFDPPTPYLVQTLLSGGTLQARLRDGPLEPVEAVSIVSKLAAGLERAHAEGILHRDVKPQNVLFDDLGEPRLTDFGLALDREASLRLTQTGTVLGSPGYMAPEQASNARGEVDARTDVYGLGALLYACLTGQPPFRGGSALATIHAMLEQPALAPSELRPGLPAWLDGVCLRALAKDPSRRYPDVAALRRALSDGGSVRPRARWAIALALACAVGFGALVASLGTAQGVAQAPSPTPTVEPTRPRDEEDSPSPTPPPAALSRDLVCGQGGLGTRPRFVGGTLHVLTSQPQVQAWAVDEVGAPQLLVQWGPEFTGREPNLVLPARRGFLTSFVHRGLGYIERDAPYRVLLDGVSGNPVAHGQRLAVPLDAGPVLLLDTSKDDAPELARLPGQGTPVASLAFSPDGRWLITGTAGDYEHLAQAVTWDLASPGAPRKVAELVVGSGILSLAVGAQGWVATGGATADLGLYRLGLETGALDFVRDAPALIFEQSIFRTRGLGFSPDAARLYALRGSATAGENKVEVWDRATLALIGQREFEVPLGEEVLNLALAPDGRYLAIGTSYGKVHLVAVSDLVGR